MNTFLPFALLAVAVVLISCMPWYRPDPRHVFVFQLCEWLSARDPENASRVDAGIPASEEIRNRDYRTAAGHSHGRSCSNL